MELSNVDSEALKYLQSTESTGGTTEEVSPSTTDGQGAEVSPTPEPKVAQIADDELVELEVAGQKVRKPWKQARAEMMLHADYTRKRQEEARIVKEAEQLAAAIRDRDEAYKRLISNPQNIIALYEAVTGQKLTPAEAAAIEKNGDALVTAEEVQRILEQQKAEAERIVETRIQELQDVQFLNEVDRTTNSTINAILEEHKQILGFYSQDEASLLLKRMARESQPSSIDELKTALVEAGKKLNERIESRLKEMQKASAVTQTKLTTKGIEPSGGTGVTAPKKSYGEGKTVNWNDIDKDAEAFLEATLSR